MMLGMNCSVQIEYRQSCCLGRVCEVWKQSRRLLIRWDLATKEGRKQSKMGEPAQETGRSSSREVEQVAGGPDILLMIQNPCWIHGELFDHVPSCKESRVFLIRSSGQDTRYHPNLDRSITYSRHALYHVLQAVDLLPNIIITRR